MVEQNENGRKHLVGRMAITGIVKFFNTTKGFGFAKPDDGREDVLIPLSAVQAAGLTLQDGQRIVFDIERGRGGKGPRAINLRRPEEPLARTA